MVGTRNGRVREDCAGEVHELVLVFVATIREFTGHKQLTVTWLNSRLEA